MLIAGNLHNLGHPAALASFFFFFFCHQRWLTRQALKLLRSSDGVRRKVSFLWSAGRPPQDRSFWEKWHGRLFFARQTAGRYLKSSGSLKAQVFHHEQKGKDALPSKVAFLFQCPYLVNCSELAVWDHREPEKGSRSPWKPQKKRQICPRHRHSSHGLQRCAPSCANAAAGVLLNSKSIWGTVSAHWIPVLQLNEIEAKRSRHRTELMDFTVLPPLPPLLIHRNMVRPPRKL